MEVARIRLRRPQRLGLFHCDDVRLAREEACIVQSDRGQEWGECVLPPEPVCGGKLPGPEFRVLRKATRHDFNTLDMIRSEERSARSVCQGKIEAHGLDMKLADVEYTFDRRKVVFYFTAEERVDFRELVRELAHELRVRIELRHIQVRDQAKMTGGLGCCGRQLCCATWLEEFKPISMRMAKRQDLSLNPTKISGQCSRLLCCLSYEDDQYGGKKKRAAEPLAGDGVSCDTCGQECPILAEEDELVAEMEFEDAAETGTDAEAASEISGTGNGDPAQSATKSGTKRKRRRKKRSGRQGGSAPGGSSV